MSTPKRAITCLPWYLAVFTVLFALLAACSTNNTGESGENSINKEIAQARTLEYFTVTLAGLPAHATLSLENPTPGSDPLYPGITVPCDDNDQTDTGPVNLQVGYWVHGIATGQEVSYFDMIAQVFNANGWSPQLDVRGTQRNLRGYTRDGYALIAQLNIVGELSLTGSSPCFPKANDQTSTPQPSTIPHPAH